MNISKIFFSAFLLLLSILVKSQNISNYLDDGSNRTARHILSIGYDPVNGSLPVKFERRLSVNFACVVAIEPFLIEKQRWFDDVSPIKPTGIGYSASIRAKFYYNEFPEKMSLNIYPQVSVMNGKVFTDALCGIGYQRVVFRRIIINAELGFGFRFFKDTEDSIYQSEIESSMIPHFPVTVNIGYLL
jgi:hypothetical protein